MGAVMYIDILVCSMMSNMCVCLFFFSSCFDVCHGAVFRHTAAAVAVAVAFALSFSSYISRIRLFLLLLRFCIVWRFSLCAFSSHLISSHSVCRKPVDILYRDNIYCGN